MPSEQLQQEQSPELSIESGLELKSQYEKGFKALNEAGILEILPKKEALGVMGIDGQEYPIPEYEAILKAIQDKEPILKEKMTRGFTNLQLTPIALPLELFKSRISQQIRRHFTEKKLFYTNSDKLIIEINQQEPLWIWDSWLKGELSGDTVYYPRKYGKNHGGITKLELLEKTKNTPFPGWIISLTEDLIFLPREGNGNIINGRKQLENNQSPIDYLKTLQQKPYQSESGRTIEDWLTSFAQRLEIINQISNDWNDLNAMWLLGSYDKESGGVPYGCWDRGFRRASVYWGSPGARSVVLGGGSSVRVADF